MDISNLTQAASVVPTVSKVASVPVTNKSAPQGNSLPVQGQVRAQSVTPETTTPSATPPAVLNTDDLNLLVDKANQVLQSRSSDLKFSVDEGTNINVVRIEDSETGEIIRQFPSEAMLAIARALEEMRQGSMFEEKV